LAASILGLVLLGSGGWAYLAQLRAGRLVTTERVVTQALDEAKFLRGQAKAASVGDMAKWREAIAMAKQARSSLVAGEPSVPLRAQVDTFLADLEREQSDATQQAGDADRDRRFLERLERIRLDPFVQGDKWDPAKTDSLYASAFREFGIDIDRLDPTEAGRLLKKRSNTLELIHFLDDWALIRLEVMNRPDPEEKAPGQWRRLIATARATDTDHWRNELRNLVGGTDAKAVKLLTQDERALAAQPARSLLLLSLVLEASGEEKQAEKVLKQAWQLSPEDFCICSRLARPSVNGLRSGSNERERARDSRRPRKGCDSRRPSSRFVRKMRGLTWHWRRLYWRQMCRHRSGSTSHQRGRGL
jgi:hypothetical protein